MVSYVIRQLLMFIICLNFTLNLFSQEIGEAIKMTEEQESLVLKLLSNYHGDKGTCSNLTINKAHLKTFIESGDYGPMWYGDTINVSQDGILIRYEYNITDSTTNKTKNYMYHSKDWHSDENLFIPKDKSALYVKYTCRFGGMPPSHGYANRRRDYDKIMDSIISIIKN